MCTSNMLQPDISVDVSLSHLFGEKKKKTLWICCGRTNTLYKPVVTRAEPEVKHSGGFDGKPKYWMN